MQIAPTPAMPIPTLPVPTPPGRSGGAEGFLAALANLRGAADIGDRPAPRIGDRGTGGDARTLRFRTGYVPRHE